MGRRYLTVDEVQNALGRGKAVECLIGSCHRAGVPGIRHISLRFDGARFGSGRIELRVYETVDRGYFDEEAPLNDQLDLGDADEEYPFSSVGESLAFMEARCPGASRRLVNEFMVAEEYSDRIEVARDS